MEMRTEWSSSIIMIHNFISFNAILSIRDSFLFSHQCAFQCFFIIYQLEREREREWYKDIKRSKRKRLRKFVTITEAFSFSNCLRKNYIPCCLHTFEWERNFIYPQHIYYSFVVIIEAWMYAFMCKWVCMV